MQQAPLPEESKTKSLTVLLLAALLLPPLGLILLWRRSDIEMGKKMFGSLGIAILGGIYAFLFFGPGLFVSGGPAENHYTELERHRAKQHAAAAQAQEPSSTASQNSETANSNTASEAGASQPIAAASSSARPARNYWTDFRGPSRDGRYDEVEINTKWPSGGLPRLWQQPIGGGYASFVVAEGRAFTIEQRRNQEVVAAYDVETGRELWTHAYDAEFKESAGDGPRATPTWHEGRVYSLGAQGDLRCLDAKVGKLFWSKNILADNGAQNLQWGMAASPLIVDDKVIALPGGSSGKSVVAYNKLTGARVWSSLSDKTAYTSPMLVTLAGKRQILTATASRVVGLTAENGSLLWEMPWDVQYGVSAAQPIIVNENRFIISGGYGRGAVLVEVTKSGEGYAVKKLWENISMKNKFNSSVIDNGFIYGLDEGILTCVDVETGERKWKGGRYGYGQLLLAGGHLIVITEEGELVLIKATPDQHEELSRFEALQGKTWNNPAIANGRLLVRNQTQMACFNLSGR
jgi:outer membrane protein assembly factor BamB